MDLCLSPGSIESLTDLKGNRKYPMNHPLAFKRPCPTLSSPSLAETDISSSGTGDDTAGWWGRIQRLATASAEGDSVLEESAKQAGMAEHNAYAMKRALEEWRILPPPEEDDQEEEVASTDSNSDAFADALEHLAVASSVVSSSLAEAQDDVVETTARVALEESNAMATVAENTAKEMEEALSWWKEDNKENDVHASNVADNSNDAVSDDESFDNTTTTLSDTELPCARIATQELQSQETMTTSNKGNVAEGDTAIWGKDNDGDDTVVHDIFEDTNLMEAHLVAQEQTSAVQVLCYETERMAETVARIVNETRVIQGNDIQASQSTNVSLSHWFADAAIPPCATAVKSRKQRRQLLLFCLGFSLILAVVAMKRRSFDSVSCSPMCIEHSLFPWELTIEETGFQDGYCPM